MIIKKINISKIDLEIHNGEFILMKERSIHNSNGPWFHWVIYGHDFTVGIIIEMIIDVLCEIGSDEIVVTVLSEKSDFTVIDI